MNKKAKAAMLLLVGAIISAGCAAGVSREEGKRLTEDICTRCHSLDVVEKHKDDKAGWQEVIDEMKDHGAQMTDEEETAILEYLANK